MALGDARERVGHDGTKGKARGHLHSPEMADYGGVWRNSGEGLLQPGGTGRGEVCGK